MGREDGMAATSERLAPAAVGRAVLITLGLVALALLLWAGRNVLFILFFGVLFGIFFSVFADRLVGWGIPRVVAVLLVVVSLVGLLAAFSVFLWPALREQLTLVGRELPQVVEDVAEWARAHYRSVTGQTGDAPGLETEVRDRLSAQAGAIVGGAIPIVSTAIGAIAGALVVLAVGIYTAADPGLYRRGALRLVPPRHRPRVDTGLERAATSLRRWMVGTLINMVIVGTVTGVGLWLLGVPAPVALAVIAGLLEFIPIVGPILASIPAIALALTVSPMLAVWVALFYLAVQQAESNVLTPVVMRGAARLPPALTLLFQTIMAVVFGFPGLLLAVPILAATMVLVRTLYVEPMEEDQESPDSVATAGA
jgi:predicted PurR-regulated permease PerM